MNWFDPEDDMEAEWLRWLDTRPDNIRAVADRFRPWTLYRVKQTGQLACIVSFSEKPDSDEVAIQAYCQKPGSRYMDGAMAAQLFGRFVFGLPPEALEPWPEGEMPVLDPDVIGPAIRQYIETHEADDDAS